MKILYLGVHNYKNESQWRSETWINKSFNKKIKCPYHGRTFSKDGQIINAPGFEKNKNFPTKSDSLKEYKIIIIYYTYITL